MNQQNSHETEEEKDNPQSSWITKD